MEKSVFTFSFLFVLFLSNKAQNSMHIAGGVLSEGTKEAIPYAHLSIPVFLIASALYTRGRKGQRFLFLGVALIVLGIILTPDFFTALRQV